MVMIFAGFGDHDWIVDFSRPLTGNLYFVPTAEFLDDPPLRRYHSGRRSHREELDERALRSLHRSQHHHYHERT